MTSCLLAALLLRPTGYAPTIPADFLAVSGAAGVAVAVRRPDGLTTAHAGFADLAARRPVTAQTRFRLGSVSKPVAATLAMRQVQAGKIDLDRGIAAYVSGFDDRAGAVTLRRVLSHTAGIRHYLPGRRDNSTQHRTTAQALALFVGDPLRFAPGTDYGYSTHGYTLVQSALERVSGRTFADLLAREMGTVARTLRAEDLTKPWPADRSALYRRAPNGRPVAAGNPEDNSWKYAGGGLESTAADVAAFGWRVLDDRWLRPAQRTEMWTPPTLTTGRKIGYALGWSSGPDGVWEHSGSQQGASSKLIVDPKARIVVVVLCNTQGVDKPIADLAQAVLRDARN